MVTTPQQADAYEAKFMSDGGDIVHREKKVAFPAWVGWLVLLTILAGVGVALVDAVTYGTWLETFISLGLLAVMTLATVIVSTLRVTVTNRQLTIQYGFWGPRIPLDAIESCEAEQQRPWSHGDYFVGHEGRVVRVRYRRPNGALKDVIIASADNVALAQTINLARSMRVEDEDPEEVIFDQGVDSQVEEAVAAVEKQTVDA